MKKTIIGFALALPFLFLSCGGKDDPVQNQNPQQGNETTPTVTITTPNQTISSDGGTISIVFKANGAWTASSSVDWLVFNQTSGSSGNASITATVRENSSYDQRDGIVIISSGTVSKSITVTQKQKDALLLTSNTILLDEQGGTPKIEVKSNIDYSCKVDDGANSWISILSTKGLTTTNITLSISENTSDSDRQGNVIVYSGSLSETVTIYQKAKASGQTTSLAGTSWYYTYFYSTSSNPTRQYTLLFSFRTDGTYIRQTLEGYSDADYAKTYYYGTFSGLKLKEVGYYSTSENKKNDYSTPIEYAAEIIDNVLYIFQDKKLIWTVFKL